MYILSAELNFLIPYAESLKDKRQVRRSITDKVRHKFNVSIAEVNNADIHKRLTLGIAVVSGDFTHGKKCLDEIISYMEENTEAQLLECYIDEL